ncbi:hypothetical protein D3C72_2022540 [compost metagenome]
MFGPTNAAADLIELRQPELVRAMHDQRIGVRNVEAGFNDGRRQQHVELVVVEGIHDVVEFARRHLAIGNHERHFRHLLPQELGNVRLVLNPRHDVEALPATIFFA